MFTPNFFVRGHTHIIELVEPIRLDDWQRRPIEIGMVSVSYVIELSKALRDSCQEACLLYPRKRTCAVQWSHVH